jgi:hypothetical protein
VINAITLQNAQGWRASESLAIVAAATEIAPGKGKPLLIFNYSTFFGHYNWQLTIPGTKSKKADTLDAENWVFVGKGREYIQPRDHQSS